MSDPAPKESKPTPEPSGGSTTPPAPSPGSPFDSFSKRLAKAKKGSKPTPESTPPDAPAAPVSPFDSFSKRLAKAKKGAQSPTEPPAPVAPSGDTAATNDGTVSSGPAGTGEYVVRPGDCIASIAKDAGHFWETIWDDPANADLKAARKDPNVLLPDDRVHVPPLREKWQPGQTEMRHRFRRKGQPEVFRLRLLRDGKPRGNEPYVLTIDGNETRGVVDAGGNIACPILPNARNGVLLVGTEPDVDRYDLSLGVMDPIDQLVGVQKRLNNLGFFCGEADGKWGPLTETAVRRYQKSRGIQESGKPDDVTRSRLQKDYGC